MKDSTRPGLRLDKLHSLLFVRLGKLGDLMVASWVFKRVREQYPRLRLGLLTLPRSRELFKYNPDLDVLRLWRPWALPALALGEWRQHWDLLVDLNDDPSRSSALALRLIRPQSSLAFHNDLSSAVFENTIPTLPKEKSHALERLAAAAKALGVRSRPADLRPVAYIPKNRFREEQARQNQRTGGGRGARVVALNLSAGHGSRYWAPEKWSGLARALLRARKDVWLKILCAPKDSALADQLAAVLDPSRVLPRNPAGFHDFLVAIATSDLVVTADTSAVHAAAAFGVTVLGLYPEPLWNLVSWKPLGVRNKVLRSTSTEGIDVIPLSRVQEAALELLRKIVPSRAGAIPACLKESLV